MEKDVLYLLTVGQVLENTKNISNVNLYYNRISVVNNLRRYENHYCWVHETKSNLQAFPDNIQCACSSVEAKSECDSTQAEHNKNLKCLQESYVSNLFKELNNNNLVVDFSSSQCIALIYKGRLYLYSNLSTCKLNTQSNNYNEKNANRDVICEVCRIRDFVEFSKTDIERALYEIIEKGEDKKYGLTLLEHTSLPNLLAGLDKVQDSVKSIGILEGLIREEPKESSIDNINVIDCDILLEDVNTTTSPCHHSKLHKDGNCKYDLNKLKIFNCSPKTKERKLSCSHCTSFDTHTCTKDCKSNNKCLEDCKPKPQTSENHIHCDQCGCTNNKCDKECKLKQVYNVCHCSNCTANCGTECKVKHSDFRQKNCTLVTETYLRDCTEFANQLVEKAKKELDSICSSLINQVNSVCQPPLNISIRFLDHFLCFEYLIEYTCDLNNMDKDTLYGVAPLNKQNVILHEFIQANVLTKPILEETFRIILNRIKMYIIPKPATLNNFTGGFEHPAATESNNLETNFELDETKEEEIKAEVMEENATRDTLMSEPSTEGMIYTPSPSKGIYIPDHMISGFDMGETKLVDSSSLNVCSNLTNSLGSNLDSENGTTSDNESYKNSFVDLDNVKEKKNSDSSDIEMGETNADTEIYPYWWSFYVEDNTLGEGDLNGRYEGIRRFTRSSYMKEESSTPKNKKTGNGANYLLTRCVSSDFSTKSNINVSALHSSRETLSPSEFNQSQPSTQAYEPIPCFCRSCISFISNITRLFPNQVGSPSCNPNTSDSSLPTPESSFETNRTSYREDDLENEIDIVNGLRRSIRTALDVGTAIKKKLSSEYKPLIDTLNVALLSTFRLGEFLFNSNLYQNGALDDSRSELCSEPPHFKDSNLDGSRSRELDLSSRSLDLTSSVRSNDLAGRNGSTTNQSSNFGLNSFSSRSMEVDHPNPSSQSLELESEREEENGDVGDLIYLDIGVDTNRSTFENDQYLNYDIMSEDDACSFSSLSSNSPKMFNKRKSPSSRSRRPYRSLSSFENLPSSRRSTRDLSQTDDMYIYDMNNLSDKGEFDEWYNEDSDSSKKSVKYVQKRMPPSRPSVSNLTEIYGSQDMLIPMGPLPIGVYFDASRKLWRCQWRENGKFRTKGFSLGHYNTLADARHACILFRCQVGNMNIQPEWLTPNYIKVSELLNRRSSQPSTNTPKKSSRKKKRQEDLYEPYP